MWTGAHRAEATLQACLEAAVGGGVDPVEGCHHLRKVRAARQIITRRPSGRIDLSTRTLLDGTELG